MDIRFIVRNVLREVGYNPWEVYCVRIRSSKSADIAAGVDTAIEGEKRHMRDPYGSIGAA